MPTEQPPSACEQNTDTAAQSPMQPKLCSSCHSAFGDPVSAVFIEDAYVCMLCREHILLSQDSHAICAEIDYEQQQHVLLHSPVYQPKPIVDTTPIQPQCSTVSSPPKQPTPLTVQTPPLRHNDYARGHVSHVLVQPPSSHHRHTTTPSHPDPLADITRLRMKTQRHHCIYPGSHFQGVQKSGRTSYEVSITIQDVDFSSSFLCGYLRIQGLTDDWPELTTYFDAEIIGARHGFLTQKWGANAEDDMLHWSRFPAFKRVRNDLREPRLTLPDNLSRSAVFLRIKEKFLVPNRASEISGASFAGIYYVCVDFGSSPNTSAPHLAPTSRNPESALPICPRLNNKDTSYSTTYQPATLSGYYWHTASEPYQQLLLNHVPERNTSSFEFL